MIPQGRQWVAREEVKCITKKGTWKVKLVISNGSGRFSTGWNKFVKDNGVTQGKTLVFSMIEKNGKIIFNIRI